MFSLLLVNIFTLFLVRIIPVLEKSVLWTLISVTRVRSVKILLIEFIKATFLIRIHSLNEASFKRYG